MAELPLIPDELLKFIVDAQIKAESSGNPDAVSPKGARGLMQIMPGTARGLGVDPSRLNDPVVNVDAGTRYDKQMFSKYGSVPKMLEAYNAGPGRVDRGSIPAETRGYVSKVMNTSADELWNSLSDTPPQATSETKKADDFWNSLSSAPPKGAKIKPPDSAAGWTGLKDMVVEDVDQALQGPITDAVGKVTGKRLAPYVAPQNITNLALMNFAPLMPEAGILKRGLMMGGVGYGAGKVTGEGGGQGAITGAGGEVIAAPVARGVRAIGRKVGESPLIQQGTQDVIKVLRDIFPAAKELKLDTGTDLQEFTKGNAINKMANRAAKIENEIKRAIPAGRGRFRVDLPDGPQWLTLDEVKSEVETLNNAGWTPKGETRATIVGPKARQLGYKIRQQTAAQMNTIKNGMGDAWLASRKAISAAKALQSTLKGGAIKNGEISQEGLSKSIMRNYEKLAQNFGKTPEEGEAAADKLLAAARQGAPAESYHTMSKPGEPKWRLHGFPPIFPARHMEGKVRFRPAAGGKTPWWMMMNPPRTPFALAGQRAVAPASGRVNQFIEQVTGEGDDNQ